MRMRFAPEGWLFVVPVVILAAVSLLLQQTIFVIVFGLVAAFLINFFRDPHRAGSDRHVDVLSPAASSSIKKKATKSCAASGSA